jgi:hypothetical protein
MKDGHERLQIEVDRGDLQQQENPLPEPVTQGIPTSPRENPERDDLDLTENSKSL